MKKDQKLQMIIPKVQKLLHERYVPILFSRFIPTAEYAAAPLWETRNCVRRGWKPTVTPQFPADIPGFYVYLSYADGECLP